MERVLQGSVFGLLAIGALSLTACGGGSDSGASTGALSINITDAPVDGAQEVVIQFHGLELHGPGGTTTLYFCRDAASGQTVISPSTCAQPASPPPQLDLLALNSGTSAALLNAYMLPAGHYSWIRLLVDADPNVAGDSYIVLENASNQYELTIPSGDESGLKLNRGFTVPAGGHASFTIDFDLRKSVHLPSAQDALYVLRPTLRIVDNVVVGAIAGTVTFDSATCANPAVYIYAGANVTPNDISGTPADPVTTALVNTTTGQYRAAFLEAGTYTVAWTCAAAQDDPAIDDNITFMNPLDVTVSAGATSLHNF
jgi:hypothetical protein